MSTPRCACPLCQAHDEILARNVAQVEARIEEIATSGEKVFDARRHNAMVEHTTDRIFVKALDPFFHADPDWGSSDRKQARSGHRHALERCQMSSKIHESNQILRLIPTARFGSKLCSSCHASADRAIESGLTGPMGSSTTVLALCNVCLSRLRELITAYEHAEPEKRSPVECAACMHGQGTHYSVPDEKTRVIRRGCAWPQCECLGFEVAR